MKMKIKRNRLFSLIFFAICPLLLFPEGTKQIMPKSTQYGQLCFNKSRNDFGFYGAAAEYRINITIADISEKVRFGFGQVLVDDVAVNDLYYRIKNPSGNIIAGPNLVPSSGTGFIETYEKAVAGPFPSSGGYDYLEFQPTVTGNFYLEFYYAASQYSDVNKHMLKYFDITVVNNAGAAINGRVWSQAWHIWSGTTTSGNRFCGSLMTYSDDSIVTQVNCNGLTGGEFSFSSNMTGCANTGNIMVDRKSRSGFHTYPRYKVFLNDPDSNIFPTQKITSGIVQPVLVTTDCVTGKVEFGIRVILDGTVELLIELNPTTGADPEDIRIVANVKADPGGDGFNYITWNGNDNYGNPVSNATPMTVKVTYLSGLTHLPIYDIESNNNGYIVQQVRPKGGQLKIFWDDTSVGGTYDTVTGCSNSGGCHAWAETVGDKNTINSWWYVTRDEIPSLVVNYEREPQAVLLTGDEIYCIGSGSLQYSIEEEPNSTSYEWSYSGTGVTISGSGTEVTLDFAPDATPGTLSVKGLNACGAGTVASLAVVFDSLPDVSLLPYEKVCYTAPGFLLTGGTPAGGTYFVDGTEADSLYPFKETEGLHSIVYSYSKASGFTSSDTSDILLYSGPACEAVIFFPNAFTPNADGLNDEFRPVVEGVYRFRIYIYNKWGQLVFSSGNVSEGWDGTFEGKPCPAGVYSYTSTYGLSLRENDNQVTRGTLTLLR